MESVITHLIGGLGNQMFQYAAGYALSRRLNAHLKFDISDFSNYRLHNGLELVKVFNCPLECASQQEIEAILGRRINIKILDRIQFIAYRQLYPRNILVESYRPEDELKADLPTYIRGYWQSERYFIDYSQDIRRVFDFRLAMDNQNLETLRKILQGNSVSIHVRRGDYITNPKAAAELGATPISFFRSAISYMTRKVASPHFFVFSDDIAWAKSNLNTGWPTEYIENNHGSFSFFDMQLMSRCRHHIITNSSFSWWGAWLNPDHAKIVIGPRKWFANPKRPYNPCPPEWLLL
jgi:hypothetical protein